MPHEKNIKRAVTTIELRFDTRERLKEITKEYHHKSADQTIRFLMNVLLSEKL